MRTFVTSLLLVALANAVTAGCKGDDDDSAGKAGAGASGAAGKTGSAGKGGTAESGGSAGHAGSSGKGGAVGGGGSAAHAGNGGSSPGGDGSLGEGGAAGGGAPSEAGNGGVAGETQAGTGGESGAAGAGGAYDPACESITRDATMTSHLTVTADNEAEVFVNGTSVGTTSNWSAAVIIDVSLYLYPGRMNVVAIVGTNTSSQDGNDRGIVGQLTVDSTSGTVPLLVTDATWRVSPTETTGWSDPSFDDSSWIFATEVANMGDAPWGNIIPDSTAKWIWSAPVPASTSDKPNLESTYARREFYLGLDGTSTTATASCPPSG
ncbi:MAG TPA: hypothetical protein VMI54_20830 [Polyangiaceae bacterium]|nr:hypothetical protein [Polyangiaceae bacterium]